MENNIQIFEHEQFGKVRAMLIDGEPWFVAVDVCRVLEIKNSRDAVSRLNDDEKMTVDLSDSHSGKRGGAQFMTVVNEPGLYRLIFASRKPEALKFQRWVYHEVLPSIRKTGSYSLVAKPEPVVTFPEPIYRVYAILFKGGLVKTGCTKRLCTRMSEVKREFKREIERATKCEIVDIYFSPLMYCEDARLVERCCKEVFSSQLVKGEFFSAEFAEVCAAIDRFVKLAAVKPLVTKHYIAAEKLLADKNSV